MSKEEEKVIEMNPENTEPAGTEDIKATDFIEPQSKVRKVWKWVLGGIALLASAVVGGLIGNKLGSGDDKEDNQGAESSDEPAANE